MLSYIDFEEIFTLMQENGMNDPAYYSNYVLQPYLQNGLNYNIYDIKSVKPVEIGKTYQVKVDTGEEPIYAYFSIQSNRTRYSKPEDKVYLYINNQSREITLYYKAFGRWYEVEKVRLFVEDPDTREIESNNLAEINERLEYNVFRDGYSRLGNTYFTRDILATLLDKGEIYNIFVQKAFVDLINNPSDIVLNVIADSLTTYTDKPIDWIENEISELKDKGVKPILEDALKSGELVLENARITNRKPNYEAPKIETPKDEEVIIGKPKNDIQDKKDLLESVGFKKKSTNDKKEIEEKPKMPKEVKTKGTSDGTIDIGDF